MRENTSEVGLNCNIGWYSGIARSWVADSQWSCQGQLAEMEPRRREGHKGRTADHEMFRTRFGFMRRHAERACNDCAGS